MHSLLIAHAEIGSVVEFLHRLEAVRADTVVDLRYGARDHRDADWSADALTSLLGAAGFGYLIRPVPAGVPQDVLAGTVGELAELLADHRHVVVLSGPATERIVAALGDLGIASLDLHPQGPAPHPAPLW